MEFLPQKVFPRTLQECLESQGPELHKFPTALFCNATFDTILCWPPTLRGSTMNKPCSDIPDMDIKEGSVFKSCGIDGNWIGNYPGSKRLDWNPGWTNYSNCQGVVYGTDDANDINVSQVAPISLGAVPVKIDGANIVACILLSISVIFAMAALIISCLSKNSQPTRGRLFRNLFAALLFHDILELVINIGRTLKDAGVVNDVETCVAIGVIVTLTSSALFAWLMIIGVCFLMTMQGFIIERKIYLVLCLLGWFVPTVITTTWLSVTVLGGKLRCWFAELYIADLESSFWIVEVCNIFFLLCTWMCLLYFFVRYKKHDGQRRHIENKDLNMELSNIKQSARRVTMLLGYVTVTYIMYMLYAHWPYNSTLAYLFVLFVYSRGIVIPCLLCFLEETCQCWDGMYKVTVIRELGDDEQSETI